MTVLHFDCFSGASGDMIVGALVDLGVEPEEVRAALEQMQVPGLSVSFDAVRRGGLAATHFRVQARGEQPHRGLGDIRALLQGKAEEAIDHLRRALVITPAHADTHHNLAVALHGIGRLDEAVHHYDIAQGKNYYYYHHPTTNLWEVHPWDVDLTWADDQYGYGNHYFSYSSQ